MTLVGHNTLQYIIIYYLHMRFPGHTASIVVLGLIESRIEPEIFTTKLQKELNSSPQPCLVPFLKKSLPYLQHSLATRELTIEGVIPPTLAQVGKLPGGHSPSNVPARPIGVGGSTVMRPTGAQGLNRPTFARPALPTRPVQMSSSSLMPPPKVCFFSCLLIHSFGWLLC